MAIIFVYNFVSDSQTNEIAQNNSSNFIGLGISWDSGALLITKMVVSKIYFHFQVIVYTKDEKSVGNILHFLEK